MFGNHETISGFESNFEVIKNENLQFSKLASLSMHIYTKKRKIILDSQRKRKLLTICVSESVAFCGGLARESSTRPQNQR
jgi:hypothetical protein